MSASYSCSRTPAALGSLLCAVEAFVLISRLKRVSTITSFLEI